MRSANITLCALSLACRPSALRPTDAARAMPVDIDLVRADLSSHDAITTTDVTVRATAPTAWLRATEVVGAATIDTTLRVRAASGLRPSLTDDPAPGLRALTSLRGALPGDVITTGRGGRATLSFDSGRSVALGSDGSVELPAYAGASVMLTRGVLEARSLGGEALRVDTPSARVIVSSGRCVVGVSLDGSVGLWANGSGVTVWASPPPPEQRSTRLSAEERARLRARQGHPVLLDVDIPELAARELRPTAASPLPEGSSRGFDPTGLPHPHPPPARPTLASFERWISTRVPEERPYAHLIAIGQLSRAGAGDLADVRVVLARMRASGSTITVEAREALMAAMSLALGRATARARRGRDLASRGGDSTPLVQLAPVEAITEASWALAPLSLLSPH